MLIRNGGEEVVGQSVVDFIDVSGEGCYTKLSEQPGSFCQRDHGNGSPCGTETERLIPTYLPETVTLGLLVIVPSQLLRLAMERV